MQILKKLWCSFFFMEEGDIYSLLRIILKRLDNQPLVWRLDGSANLRVQGVDVSVHDLDIKTNKEGLRIFKECFKDCDVKESYKEDIDGTVVSFILEGFPVEVIDNKYNMLHRIKFVTFQAMSLPILPLKEAREFYTAIGREKTVAVLDRHLG